MNVRTTGERLTPGLDGRRDLHELRAEIAEQLVHRDENTRSFPV